ncbi:MAG: TonB-dependent receptor [Pseudomonadota bacterium]
MKRSQLKTKLFLTAALAACGLTPMAAVAQDDDEDRSSAQGLDQIIVTGRAGGSEITQFESSVSITTFDEELIRDVAPLVLSDLYAEVPGVWAESSGGQSASNVFIRGIPAPGQFRFSKILVDGLPVFEEQGVGFLTPDGLYRVDGTTSRLEAVRGGTSSIFASNAPGGIFNSITKKGTQDPEGAIRLEWGDFGHRRVDVNYAGPISEDTTFSVGGFYRVADGVRDPGFRADEGGQIRGSVTRQFDRGEFTVNAGYINERNLFLLAIPLDLDSDGDLTSIAGFDANFDTLVSDDQRFVSILRPDGGTDDFDLSDGIHNEAFNVGTEFTYELDNGWTITNRNRYVSGDIQFNSAIPFAFEDGNVFLANQLGAAQDAFGPDVAEVVATFADGSPFALSVDGQGGNNGNGLIGTSGFFPVNTEIENFINDFQISKSVDFLAGTHNFTGGLYTSFYSIDQLQGFGTFVHEIDGSPRNLELTAVDGAGVALGTLTQNSFTNFAGGFFQNYSGDGEVIAFYASDEWDVNDRLRIDGGVRVEYLTIEGTTELEAAFDVSANNSLLPAGALPTTADDAVVSGTGEFVPFRDTFSEFAWSFGANYVIFDELAVYARASDGFRTPDIDDLASTTEAGGDPEAVPVGDVFQVEGGFKLSIPGLEAFVTGFYSDIENLPFTEPVFDLDGNTIDASVTQSSSTLGLEAELQTEEFFGFSLNAKATFQDPELDSLEVTGGGITIDDAIFGNRVPRIPTRIVSIRPRYSFDDVVGLSGSIFADIYNVSDRFQDFSNEVLLPSYTSLGLGAQFYLENGVEIRVIADNVTNTIGLTEGNVRGDLFAPATGDVTVATFGRPIVGRNVRVSVGYSF